MKKRLLITSIVMMLVVAVALSTATYAWFTSNASVSASTVNLTAATNTAEALGIGWGASDAVGAVAGTEIVCTESATLVPMAPKALETSGGSITTFANIDFNSATIKNIDSKPVFNGVDDSVTAVNFKSGANTTFFVKNLSTANTVDHVYMRATIAQKDYVEITDEEDVAIGYTYYGARSGSGTTQDPYTYTDLDSQPALGTKVSTGYKRANDASDLVRIAVFKKVGANYNLIGVMATTNANTVKGTIAENAFATVGETAATVNGTSYAASPMTNFTATPIATGFDLGSLAAQASHDIAVLVWLDGAALTDVEQGYKAEISFTFTKS